ncbi:MAG: glycoside hydrolase family 2 protein [Verrucomicrobiota bacterium JB024]|nr:glycoside hydrolase family 2 protein [Verrucomicrobiota bacterium JB024]
MQFDPIDLTGIWQLLERPLGDDIHAMRDVQDAMSDAIVCHVPGDVSDSLVQAGKMPEPLVGLNFQQFDWIDDRSWWMTREVEVPAEWETLPQVQLLLDGLDYGADIWLNGHHLGHHDSAFYPFTCDVKPHLQCGSANTLLVRLTTGRDIAEQYRDDPLCNATATEAARGYPERGMKHRIFLRKPAYTWGWDWGPYLATCGITGHAMLKPVPTVQINDVAVVTTLQGKDAIVDVCVETNHQSISSTCRADVTVSLTDEAGKTFSTTRSNVTLSSGLSHLDLRCIIPDARLWWPNGTGEQHRYELVTSIAVKDQCVHTRKTRIGLRTVRLIDEPGHFAFAVNGQPIFIKGGNWIPSDSLYGRISDAKLTTLVAEAANANFNCLRVWGGGRYEADRFYDACDEYGILLWHDFMSACAALPADRDWFVRSFEAEARYQIKRLRNRACLMLWCGNNEVSQFYDSPDFADKIQQVRDPGWALYHELLPALIRELCPQVPYRPTSPYGGATTVHDHREGDCHHWTVMLPETEYWSNPWYWDTDDVPIFNSEYGYGGPCCIESTKQYLDSNRPNLFDETGRQHTNTFYDIRRVNFSITEHYRDAEGLSLEQYILLGGLCQGLNLGYSLESMRANPQTMGGIFWMYNDTWGENGWTIVDYNLRRKISYYNVKRSLAHQRLLLRKGGQVYGGKSSEILLMAVNDTPSTMDICGRWGYQRYDGSQRQLTPLKASVPPFDHSVIATMPMPSADQLEVGTVIAIPDQVTTLEPVSWLRGPYRTLHLPDANVQIKACERADDKLLVTVKSDVFAHAVHLNIPGDYRLSDHYFDLFAGESRTVVIEDAQDIDVGTLTASCVNQA